MIRLSTARSCCGAYLRKASERLGKGCAESGSAIFIIGHSLSDVDQHITDLIGDGAAAVFIGVHRPSDDGSQAAKVARCWAERRREAGRPTIDVFLFNSAECAIWEPREATAKAFEG